MSEPLTIKTQFSDISHLAQGFVERVGEDQIILSSASRVVEGEWAQFIVYLADGIPAFAGVGRCLEVIDNGVDAPDEARYDLLLDSLRFEEDSQAVFDHLLLVKNDLLSDVQMLDETNESDASEAFPVDLNTAELKDVSLDEVSFVDLREPADQARIELVDPAALKPADIHPEQAERAGDIAERDESVEQARDDRSESEFVPQKPIPGLILLRPVIARDWQPQAQARPEPRPSTELFRYNGNGLPYPDRPPRPELDPSLWVHKAAHPKEPRTTSRERVTEARAAAAPSASIPSEAEQKSEEKRSHLASQLAAKVGRMGKAAKRVGRADQGDEEPFPEEIGTAEIIDGDLEEIDE
ncbi:MAG: hypothetical protein JXA30_02920 [Deltaproteobacteria bacterium]|nr:hypothetical protein [Deltaproteobacteria bacterium]